MRVMKLKSKSSTLTGEFVVLLSFSSPKTFFQPIWSGPVLDL